MEEEEIEQTVDKKFQEIIVEGITDREMITKTEVTKAIKGMKNKKKHETRITGKQNGQKRRKRNGTEFRNSIQ